MGNLWAIYGNLWKFMGIYGKLWDFFMGFFLLPKTIFEDDFHDFRLIFD